MTETFPVFRKTLLVQLGNKKSDEQKCKYYVPVCLKKVLCLFSAIQYYCCVVFFYDCVTTKFSYQHIVANV